MQTSSVVGEPRDRRELPPTAEQKQTFLLAAQGQMETSRSIELTTAMSLPESVKAILLAQPLNPLVRLAFSTVRHGPQGRRPGDTVEQSS